MLVLLLALAAGGLPARAQTTAGGAGFEKSLADGSAALKAQVDRAARGERLLQRIKSAMDAQGDDGVGPQITYFLQAYPVRVDFRDQEPLVEAGAARDGDKTLRFIHLRSSLADAPPAYAAIHLADGVIRLMNAEFPETVEKVYMRLSFMARAWLELRGNPSALPDFGGLEDRKTAALLNAWLSSRNASDLVSASGLPSVAQLQGQSRQRAAALRTLAGNGLPIDRTALANLNQESLRLSQADLRFFSFMKQERNWIEWRASR